MSDDLTPDDLTPDDHDAQELAEILDEEARDAEDPPVHTELLAPDLGGNDDVAELVASAEPAEGPIGPEEAAVHVIPD